MPNINLEIIEKKFTETPSNITNEVLEFCTSITKNPDPQFTTITPSKGAEPSECYFNVKRHVEIHGGEIVYGWAIWYWEGVFIEAEHHAVWSSKGELLDITPPLEKENEILFLTDDSKIFDFDTFSKFGNIRKPLNSSPWVKRWIEICDYEFEFQEKHRAGRCYNFPQEEYEYINKSKVDAWLNIIVEEHGKRQRNQSCICSSGQKFKKCCLPLVT